MTPTLRLIGLFCFIMVTLSACGQKGPLYIKQTQADDKPSKSNQHSKQE